MWPQTFMGPIGHYDHPCTQDVPEGLRLMGLAWLISPFGLPLIAAFLVELLGVFNDSLKAI